MTITFIIISTILRLILLLPMQLVVYNVYIVLILIKIIIPLISADNGQKSENEKKDDSWIEIDDDLFSLIKVSVDSS